MKKCIWLMALVLCLSGCASGGSQVRKENALVIHVPITGTLYVSTIEDRTAGQMVNPQILSEIRNTINERISKNSQLKLASSKESADYILNIKINVFTAGNRAARFWIGCGLGAAHLNFICELLNKEGKVLDSQNFQRFGAFSLRSGPELIQQMQNLIIDYVCAWLKM